MATRNPGSSQARQQLRQQVWKHQENTLGTHRIMRKTRFPETAVGADASSTFINKPHALLIEVEIST
ncbi:MAG: hypothetical protein VX346_14260 [Planctomycetota bacterium]|nr:hypothetical protein [Planctomycetota bacterium]